MINLSSTCKEIFNNKVDALGLSVFRVLYAIVLFFETTQLFKYRHIVYDKNSFVSVGEIDVTFIFFFWFIILGMLMLGLFTRFTTIVNYIFGVIIFSSANSFEYHIFYMYVGVNFLLMFMPISRVFSLDSLCQKLKYSRVGFDYKIDRKILEINYLIVVFSAIALVYFDSIFQKISSPMWRSGLGLWLPSSLPMVTWNNASTMLNQEWLMKFLGYFVLLFEGCFIFLFWFKKLRISLMLIGIFFHIGILVLYPIPWFALSVTAVYLLMLPEKFWLQLSNSIKYKKSNYLFLYDSESPLCNKVVFVIKHFDIFNGVNCLSVQENYRKETSLQQFSEEKLLTNIHGIDNKGNLFAGYDAYVQLFKYLIYTYPLKLFMLMPGISLVGKRLYQKIAFKRVKKSGIVENYSVPVYHLPVSETDDFLVKGWNKLNLSKLFWKFVFLFLLLFQCMLIWISPTGLKFFPTNFSLNKIPLYFFNNNKDFLKNYLGITYHPVFLESHFRDYNHILKITFFDGSKEHLVPLLNEKGMPGEYLKGEIWSNFTFSVISPLLCKSVMEKGLDPYLKLYLSDKKINASNVDFNFYIKEIETAHHWEKDFLQRQIDKPWKYAGSCKLTGFTFNYYWNDSTKLLFTNEIKYSHWLK